MNFKNKNMNADVDLLYREIILDYFKNPRNKRVIPEALHHKEYNPLCGDIVDVFVSVKDSTVTDASFIGSGCAISQAVTSILTEFIVGKTLAEVNNISNKDISELTGVSFGLVRLKCAMLGLVAFKNAISSANSRTHKLANKQFSHSSEVLHEKYS